MPHRFKTVEQSDEIEIQMLLGTLDKGNPVGDAAALRALGEILEQPEVDRLSPEVLKAIHAALKTAAGSISSTSREAWARPAQE